MEILIVYGVVSMSREPSPWGPIIYSGEEPEEDEISKLIREKEELAKKPIEFWQKEGEGLESARKRRRKKLSEMERKIWDMISLKRQKRWNRE